MDFEATTLPSILLSMKDEVLLPIYAINIFVREHIFTLHPATFSLDSPPLSHHPNIGLIISTASNESSLFFISNNIHYLHGPICSRLQVRSIMRTVIMKIGLQQDVKAVLFRHKSKCPFGRLNRKTNNKIYYIFLDTFFFLFSFSHQKEENKISQGCEKCNSRIGSKQRTMDDSEVKTSKGISVK